MKNKFLLILFTFIFLPNIVFGSECGNDDYTVFYINGIFVKNQADSILDRKLLESVFKEDLFKKG